MSNSIIKRNPRVTRTKSFKQEMADRKAAAMKRLKAFWEEYQNMTPEQQQVISTAAAKLGDYSIRNKILIHFQAYARGFEPSAVCPFSAWKQVGRHVKKGEKGLEILVPMNFKGKAAPTPEDCAMAALPGIHGSRWHTCTISAKPS